MGSRLATKSDIQLLRQELMAKMYTRAANEQMLSIRSEFSLLRKEMELFSLTMTLRFGFMLTLSLGLLFVALKLTQ